MKKHFGDQLGRLQNVPVVERGSEQPKGTLVKDSATDLTPSQFLYGRYIKEVDRTLVSCLSIRWLFYGDYDAFKNGQPDNMAVKEETFHELREFARVALSNWDPDHVWALIVSLILGDLGKNPVLQQDVQGNKVEQFNHDQVLQVAVGKKLPIVQKPLQLLSEELAKCVEDGITMGAGLNIPQLIKGENVPGSLESVRYLKGKSFDLKYLEMMLDVCGAGGHIDARGAVRMIEPVCQSFLGVRHLLKDVSEGNRDVVTAYDEALEICGKSLIDNGFRKLDTKNTDDRCLLRILRMGRVIDKDRAQRFETAFNNLPEDTRMSLVDGLSDNGVGGGTAVILYYMPAVFAEVLRVNHEASEVEIIEILMS